MLYEVITKWKNTKSEGKFLYPVKALSAVFRGKFCDYLMELHNNGVLELATAFDPMRKYLHPFYKNKWVVYAKLPMYNSKQVLEYISRYSHRVAISNHRIKDVDDDNVYFSWLNVITSYSIHYTKLYEDLSRDISVFLPL